jgi:hypothetical protein
MIEEEGVITLRHIEKTQYAAGLIGECTFLFHHVSVVMLQVSDKTFI